jgi:hypothetical protein
VHRPEHPRQRHRLPADRQRVRADRRGAALADGVTP